MFGCVRDYDLTLLAPIEKPNTKAVSQRTKELHGEEKNRNAMAYSNFKAEFKFSWY